MKTKLRKIVVDGRQFVWVLPGNSLELGNVHLSVFASKRTQPLRIDPFPWAFTVRPQSVADAIRFALTHGWSPGEPGPPFFIALREGELVVLPPGVRFLHELRPCGESRRDSQMRSI
jgi:hypothetical protein